MAAPADDGSSRQSTCWRLMKRCSLPVLICMAIAIWGHHRLELVIAVLFFVPLTAVSVGAGAIVGACCGAAIERVSIFSGRPWCRFSVRGIPVEIGCWPFSGSMKFDELDFNDGRSYGQLRSWKRLLITMSGPVTLLIMGCLFLGGDCPGALRDFYPTFVGGTLSPRSQGVEAMAAYFRHLAQGDYRTAFGLLAVVFAAVNLLPLPTLNGGEAVMELVQALSGRRFGTRSIMAMRLTAMLVLMAAMVSWALALVLLLFFR